MNSFGLGTASLALDATVRRQRRLLPVVQA